jgi:hypothetical protein
MTDAWPFDDAPNTACITTRFVLEDGAPILLVTHDEGDGGWQFLCGSTNNPDDGRVIGLDCALTLDLGLAELADLPLGWKAWRDSPDHEWDRCANDV